MILNTRLSLSLAVQVRHLLLSFPFITPATFKSAILQHHSFYLRKKVVWAVPRSLAATDGISVISFPGVT